MFQKYYFLWTSFHYRIRLCMKIIHFDGIMVIPEGQYNNDIINSNHEWYRPII